MGHHPITMRNFSVSGAQCCPVANATQARQLQRRDNLHLSTRNGSGEGEKEPNGLVDATITVDEVVQQMDAELERRARLRKGC
jgi:hypothetical protein